MPRETPVTRQDLDAFRQEVVVAVNQVLEATDSENAERFAAAARVASFEHQLAEDRVARAALDARIAERLATSDAQRERAHEEARASLSAWAAKLERRSFGTLLASGALAAANTGFVNGQLYADALTERSLESAQARLADIHAAIAEELDAASSYDDFRTRMRARYAKLDPEQLNTIVFSAMAMAELAGMVAVNEDV